MLAPLPPGQFGLPVLGETIDFLRDSQFAAKRHEKYGRIFKSYLFGKPTVFLQGADGNRFIFSHENEFFQIYWPPTFAALLGRLSLTVQTGHEHVSRRKLLAQAFQPRALEGYVDVMDAVSDRYFERWLTLGHFSWYLELRHYTLDIACKLLVGLDQGSETPLGHYYETWTAGLFGFPINLPFTAFGKALRSRSQLLVELEKLIRSRMEQSNRAGATDALDLLLAATDDDGQKLSLDELKDQILVLLFAGHETLSSALTSTCLLLAQHPEVLAKARAEQEPFRSQPLTFETLKQMTYLDQVLKEVLRVVPPVGGGFREVIRECEYEGHRLPQGWQVLYQVNPTHQDVEIYTDPDRFDPDRFSPERVEDRAKRFSHIPFGGGLRECLGKEFARLEMKIFAARLLQRFEWQLLPDQDLTLVTIPIPKPKDNLKVTFQRYQPHSS